MPARQGSFESFRAQRATRALRRLREGRPVPEGAELLRLLESAERQENFERQLRREMEEFFEESGRLAAQALRKLTESERKRIEQKVLQELREFLEEARRRAADLALRLKDHEEWAKKGNGNGGEAQRRSRSTEGRPPKTGNGGSDRPRATRPYPE